MFDGVNGDQSDNSSLPRSQCCRCGKGGKVMKIVKEWVINSIRPKKTGTAIEAVTQEAVLPLVCRGQEASKKV